MRFILLPFAENDTIDALEGSIELDGNHITCRWSLEGALDKIAWPERAAAPERKMSLWEHTCFEFFIGVIDESAYYELNLAPSGHWNSFNFTDVRTDMAETPALTCLSCSIEQSDRHRRVLAARFRFDPHAAGPYRIGVSAVIEETAGKRHYYALAHDGERPDFHRRSNHTLVVP